MIFLNFLNEPGQFIVKMLFQNNSLTINKFCMSTLVIKPFFFLSTILNRAR